MQRRAGYADSVDDLCLTIQLVNRGQGEGLGSMGGHVGGLVDGGTVGAGEANVGVEHSVERSDVVGQQRPLEASLRLVQTAFAEPIDVHGYSLVDASGAFYWFCSWQTLNRA